MHPHVQACASVRAAEEPTWLSLDPLPEGPDVGAAAASYAFADIWVVDPQVGPPMAGFLYLDRGIE
jgi:hypothetical protein